MTPLETISHRGVGMDGQQPSSPGAVKPDLEWIVNQVAHALRNPVFAALVQAEVLELRASDAQTVSAGVALVHAQLKRLETIIDEMLIFGRPANIERRPARAIELVEPVLESVRSREGTEPAAVRLVADSSDLEVDWDPRAVKLILERLLDNAVRHTESPHEIQVTLDHRDGVVELSVHDEGEGMTAEILANALLPFFPQHGGRAGLGLAIAEKYARALGGQLDIQSREGHGTTVRCSLPRR